MGSAPGRWTMWFGRQQFKGRPLEREYPYVWLDATFPKAKDNAVTLLDET